MVCVFFFSLTLGQPRDYSNSVVAAAVADGGDGDGGGGGDADKAERWSTSSLRSPGRGCRGHDGPGACADVAPPRI